MSSKQKRHWEQLFNEVSTDKTFHDKGFILHPFLTSEECELINNEIKSIVKISPGLYHSRIHTEFENRETIHDLISAFIMSKISRLPISKSYKIMGAVYVSKSPSNESNFGIHTDDSLCDERYFLPFNIWIPLVNVNEYNGSIHFYPETHLNTSVFRGATIEDSYIKEIKEQAKVKPVAIETDKGTAVIYHPGCIHFSGNNLSDSDRPALVLSFIPSEAEAAVFLEKKTFFSKRIYKFNIERPGFDFHSWNNRIFPPFKENEIIR